MAKTFADMIADESPKQIVRRILRCYDAQMTLENNDDTMANRAICAEYEQKVEMCREEIFIRMYNKGLIDDWTNYEGLPADCSDEINTYLAGIAGDALWVLGNGDWC